MATIGELIERLDALYNRYEHGIIDMKEYHKGVVVASEEILNELKPKSGFEREKVVVEEEVVVVKEEPKKEEGHHLFGHRHGKK